MTHDQLVKLAVRWLKNRWKCPIVITELVSASRETPDAIGFKGIQSWLVECKTSRADFKADNGKSFRGNGGISAMGRKRYYLVPAGLIDKNELPEKWGLLETDGKEVTEVIGAVYRDDTTRDYEIELLTSALRRVACQPKIDGVMVRVYADPEKHNSIKSVSKAAIYAGNETENL